MSDPEYISISAAARRIGITTNGIYEARDRGEFSKQPNGKYLWDDIKAWRARIDPHQAYKGKIGGVKGRDHDGPETEMEKDIQAAKLENAVYRAKREQLAYERESAELIDRSAVENIADLIESRIRARLEAWSPDFADHMTDTGRAALQSEVSGLLDELSFDLKRLTAA